ncbi:hypothetical protein AB0M39_38055 [Streptomyces sp. NPDC051907]|uniref:hypothetical protein n=1 Tax=Streptomyces sp. NPDC051907 TaxID=3155284 RepID=UPI00344A0A93
MMDVPDDWEYEGDEPPPRGTLAYRRLILTICAAGDYKTFHARLAPPWQWVGWRLGLDVITEMLLHFSRSFDLQGAHRRDAFGHIKLSDFLRLFTEEERLRSAAAQAKALYPELPTHEAFVQAMAGGEEVWGSLTAFIPVCQQALNAIEASGGQQEPAWPILLKHLSRDDDRLAETNLAVSMVHASLRGRAMPQGEGWVDNFLREDALGTPPEVTGSLAYYQGMDAKARHDAMPSWWHEGRNGEGRGREPRCACGRHRPNVT